ncbi:MAG: hypothetical protein IKP02_10200 [Paludibacteraceae bacterium]|nr:hypothetical protein [Paludibacteraceae bacterium]
MKINVFTLKQQTREFILRLFVESSGGAATGSDSQYYISSHCGTYSRLHS